MDLRSEYPYWLLKNGIVKSYPSLQDDISTDVAIIGAGISGALVAYYLAKRGCKAVIIDKRHVGMGSTAASTSLLQYEIDTPLHELSGYVGMQDAVTSYKLCLEAIGKINEICGKLDAQLKFPIIPSMQFASYQSHVGKLREEYVLRKKHGFDVSWLEPDEIQDKFHFSAPAAILSATGGSVDAYLLTHRLLEHCQKKGHQVFDNTNVTAINHQSRNVVLQTDTGRTVRAKKLVIACGYESLRYIPSKVAELQATYAIVTEPIDKEYFWHRNSLIWETKSPYMYMRLTKDGRIIAGGRDDDSSNPVKRDKALPQKAKQLANDLQKKMPHLSVKTDFYWAGTFASTKDGLPYIGSIAQLPHTYFALGFGGNGITFSQIAGEILADLITGRKNEHAAIFSFDR